MPEIDRYVTSLPQNRRAKVQVLFNKDTKTAAPISSEPLASPTTEQPQPQQQQRRASKVTDFPTEIERPSLPVTPAPVQRPRFWSAERDAQGDLPAAEGVPEQSAWDPVAKLAELQRRQSEVLEKGDVGGGGGGGEGGREIPERKMPESSRVGGMDAGGEVEGKEKGATGQAVASGI